MVHLAVNGTLMKGLELHANLVNSKATFVKYATVPHRLTYGQSPLLLLPLSHYAPLYKKKILFRNGMQKSMTARTFARNDYKHQCAALVSPRGTGCMLGYQHDK